MTQDDSTDAPGAPVPLAPGSVPLKVLRHEFYAQQRALACPPESAAQRAGYPPRCGMHSKLERKAAVRARIAFLRRDDDELLLRKRERLEEELYRVVDFDLLDFAAIDEATGHLVSIDWRQVRESGSSKAVSEFNFDPKSGLLTKFKRDDRLNAISQLRDMYGFRAASRLEATGADGASLAPVTVQVVRLSET